MPSTKPKTKSTAKAAPKPRQTYAEWLDAVARMNPYIANEAAKTPPKTDANGIHWLNIDHIYDSLRQQAIRDYPPGSRMLREVLAEVDIQASSDDFTGSLAREPFDLFPGWAKEFRKAEKLRGLDAHEKTKKKKKKSESSRAVSSLES